VPLTVVGPGRVVVPGEAARVRPGDEVASSIARRCRSRSPPTRRLRKAPRRVDRDGRNITTLKVKSSIIFHCWSISLWWIEPQSLSVVSPQAGTPVEGDRAMKHPLPSFRPSERSRSGRTVDPSLERWDGPGQAIPTRFRAYPHMSRDLRVSVTIKCSKSNSDMVRVLRYPRKHGRPATGTKASPRAGWRLIFGHQIFAGNDAVPFKWNPCVGGKGRPIGSSTELAMTKPNLTDGSNDLELEAAAKAPAANNCRWHSLAARHANFSTLDHVSWPAPFLIQATVSFLR